MPDSVRFTETMTGRLSRRVTEPHVEAARGGEAAQFTLVVVTPDVDAMVADPQHRSPAFGCVLADGLPSPLRVVAGNLDLFVDVGPNALEMRYGLGLEGTDGSRYFLRGVKDVRRRRWYPTFVVDTTRLFVDLYAGDAPTGEPVLRGALWMGPLAVAMQGISFRGGGGWLGMRGIARYMAYYVRRVAAVVFGARS